MMLSCPSKTFLLGEYLALKGEPCLLACTEPRFQLQIRQGQNTSPFHPESPAGRLWARSIEITRNWSGEFVNPAKVGGLGASSAEFLLLWTALQMQKTLALEAQLEHDYSEMLRTYAELCGDKGVKPSGADIVAQLKGQVTLFQKNRGRAEMRGWGMEKLSFLLFATGTKVATHEHLRNLGEWDASALQAAVEPGIQAWMDRDPKNFVESVRRTRHELKQLDFEAPSTTTLLQSLMENPRILAAKGCGALGADVLMVVCDRAYRDEVREQISKRLMFLGSEASLSEGLQVIPMTVASEAQI